ncbi:MAG: hypothetical protein EOM03_04905 [Clostridia bacterium]|nr:hypothetical protein [Clostridia bacterium]
MDREQLMILGRVLGWLIAGSFVLAALNPALKKLNLYLRQKRAENDPLRRAYASFLRFYLKAHSWIGRIAATLLLAHFFVQYQVYGVSASGLLAGGLLMVLAGLGAFGYFIRKKKAGTWLVLHRWVTFILAFAIILHVVLARL